MAGNDAEPSPINSKEDTKEDRSSITSSTIQHNNTEVAQETSTIPIALKCSEFPQGGALKNGSIPQKAKNFKAGFKINQLADKLAKISSLKVLEVGDTAHEPVPLFLPVTSIVSDPSPPPCLPIRSEDISLTAATPLPLLTSSTAVNFQNPSLPTKLSDDVCNIPLNVSSTEVSNSQEVEVANKVEEKPPEPPDKVVSQSVENVNADLLSVKIGSKLTDDISCTDIPTSHSLESEKPADVSTAFNDTENSTKERIKKRSSPRCKKEVDSVQTDSVVIRGKTKKPNKKNRKLVEMSTQTAAVQIINAVKEEPLPLPKIDSPTFICLFCQLTFRDKTDCLNHEATHSLKRKTKFIKCQFCSKKLPNLEEFKSHSTKFHRPNFHLCTECDLRFLNNESLVLHTQMDHFKIDTVDKTQFSILNKKVRISTSLDIDVSFDSTQKKPSISPRCSQKPSPKDKTEEYEAEMLFYSYLSGNIKENLSNHLDGKIDQFDSNIDPSEISKNTSLLTVAPNTNGTSTIPVTRAPSPYQTRSKTPNPLPTSAKKFKKLPNWQQKFWEKYNFPTNYRFEHRFWDKNYINTEKSALYLKDLSCLDIKTQLTMRENVKKLDPKVTKDDVEKNSFPYMIDLIPQGRPAAVETVVVSKEELSKIPKKKVVKESKTRRVRAADGLSNQVVTRQQKGMEGGRERKGSLDLGVDKKAILRRQTSLENIGSPSKEKEVPNVPQEAEKGSVGVLENSVMSGEWVRPRSYLCGTCCTKFASLWELEDHKYLAHPNVYCTHYEFENDKVDNLFQLEAESPQVARITLPDLYRRYLHPQGSLQQAEPSGQLLFPQSCSKCQKSCANQPDLHKHILDCGGDTTWSLTMTASPAANKRRWRPYGSRRRKAIGQRSVKRNIPPTPNQKTTGLHPKIRTKPGDVESIQKMLANLPEKRTRRAINFDSVSTRSQTTIHSHRYLRKRMTAQFNRNFLRRKVLSNVRSKQLKVTALSRNETENRLVTAGSSKSEILDHAAARRRYRLKEVTVNVTPLNMSPESVIVTSPSSAQAKTDLKKNKPKNKKNVAALKKEIKEEPTVEPEVEKNILGKIAKRKGYLVKKIKQKLSNSKKVMANRRRSERIKVKDDSSDEPLNEKKKKLKRISTKTPKPKPTVEIEELVTDLVPPAIPVTDLKATPEDATDEEVPIAKLVAPKKEPNASDEVQVKPTKNKPVKQKGGKKKQLPVGVAANPKKVVRKMTKKEVAPEISQPPVPLDVLEEELVDVDETPLKPTTPEKPSKRITRKTSEVVEIVDMPVLNKEEPMKKRQLRKSDDFPILKPAEDTDDVKIEEETTLEPISPKVTFKVVKKNGKRNNSKTKITPLKIVKEQNKNVKKNLLMDSGSDSEPLIALKQQTVKKIVEKKKVKRNVRRKLVPNTIESVEAKEIKILNNLGNEKLIDKMDSKSVHNLMIEKIINDKLNERLVKHKKAIHKRTKLQPSLKQLRMTVTLKEATLKVIDKSGPVSLPNKWTVSTPTNNVISFNSTPPCSSTDLINPIIINAKSPEIELTKESNQNITEPFENIPPNNEQFEETINETTEDKQELIEIVLDTNKSNVKTDENIEIISNANECDISTTSIEIDSTSVIKTKEIIPIFTIEEATSSEDAKPSRSVPLCNVKISEADSSVEIVSKESLYDFKIEEEVSSTKPNLKVVKKRKRVVVDLDCKEDSPTSTLNVPEQLDRRSRRRSKEVPTTNEFVIDEPLLLVDELWSDLDSDTDKRQRKKIRKIKKKPPKKNILPEKPVDLEAILRNFGETKEIEDDIICLPMRKERISTLTGREQIQQKIIIDENITTRISLRLFSYRNNVLRYGREGGKLYKAKKKVFDSIELLKAPVLSSEITENPEQVIVCRSKPKIIKKPLDLTESKPVHQRLRISLPLELLGDLPILNNNHLEAPAPAPENPECCVRPKSPEVKVVAETKPKRSEVIDKIFYCEICKTYYYSPSQLRNHKSSNRHKLKCEELGLADEAAKESEVVSKEPEKINSVTTPREEEKEDTSEMPVLEGPFIESKSETKADIPTSSGQTSVFGFSEESLKDIQKAIGCTDEEMLILTLLGENTVPEPDILDISNFTSKPEKEKPAPVKSQTKSNGAIKIDLKQRMTNALSSLVNRAVNNFLSKSELLPFKVSDKSEAATFLNKLSGLSNRRASFTQNDLALVLESIPHSSDLSEIRYKYQCSMCSNRFEKESTRDYHMTRKHRVGKRSKAAYREISPPPEDWNDSSWYDCEDLNPIESSQFLCSDCGINFLSPKEVLEHQKTEHPPESSRTAPSECGDDVKPTMKRTITLDPDQEKLLATEALQKLVGHRHPRNSKGRKSHCGMLANKVRKSDSFNDLKSSKIIQPVINTPSPKVPSPVPEITPIEVPIIIDTENLNDTDVTAKTSKNVDIYDFNEFDSDPEPVVLAHVRKSGTASQDKISESEKDDEDSEDNLPLSSVKIPKTNEIFPTTPSPEGDSIVETKIADTNRFRESLKISLESKFLRLDENSLVKSLSSSSLSDENSMNVGSVKSDQCDDSDNQPIENVVYQRNESMTSFESAFDNDNGVLSSFSDSEEEDRPTKKIIPLLSATLPNRKSESPKLNKEVIVKKIWNRQKLKLNQDSPTSDVAKGTIMKKVWRKKKMESEEREVVSFDDVQINQTEISDEVVIKCGPKPKNLNRRRSMNETAKDAIVRRIWSGKCGFQTKAALKTYDSDVFPTEIPVRNEIQVNSSSTPAKRRGRPSSVSAIKRRKVSSASEDDLDSLLEEIEQENVEKAIRSEFLHMRRSEKNPIENTKESTGLFAEIQPVENSPEKKKRKIRKNVKILKRKFDSNDFRNRRHKKHKHHHHKHKHKKSRHHKKIVHKHKSQISSTKSSINDISQFHVLDRLREESVEINNSEKFKEPRISSDLDNLDLKLNAILSPYGSTNKLNGDISDDEISITDKNIYKT